MGGICLASYLLEEEVYSIHYMKTSLIKVLKFVQKYNVYLYFSLNLLYILSIQKFWAWKIKANLHVVEIIKKNWKMLKNRNMVKSEIDAPMGKNTACDISIVCETK